MPIIAIVILVDSREDKARKGKTRQGKKNEIYIDSLHIMTMTMTMTITIIIS